MLTSNKVLRSAWLLTCLVELQLSCALVGCRQPDVGSSAADNRPAAQPSAIGSDEKSSKAPLAENQTHGTATPPPAEELSEQAARENSSSVASMEPPTLDSSSISALTQTESPESTDVKVLPFLVTSAPASAVELRLEASQLVDDLVEMFPDNTDALEVKARFHFLVGENKLAQETWERALELDPNYGYASHGLGKIAALKSEFESAIERFSRASASLPNLPDLMHDLADAYLKSGNIEQAIEVLSTFAEGRPESTKTFLLLGQAQLANQDYRSAQASFERALILQPDLPRAQEGLGRALVRLGKRDEAQKLLEAQRASRAKDRANKTQAEAFAEECRNFSSRYVTAARVYLGGGAARQAGKVLEKATVLDSANMDAWTLLLTHYQSQGDLAQAVRRAEAMCGKNPNVPGCHFTCGVLQAKNGDVAAAKVSLEEVIRLAPQSHSGYETLAKLLLQTRTDLKRAVDLAQKVVDLRGAAADHELLAQAYAMNSQFELAHQSLDRALQLDPQNENFKQAMQQLEAFRRARNE